MFEIRDISFKKAVCPGSGREIAFHIPSCFNECKWALQSGFVCVFILHRQTCGSSFVLLALVLAEVYSNARWGWALSDWVEKKIRRHRPFHRLWCGMHLCAIILNWTTLLSLNNNETQARLVGVRLKWSGLVPSSLNCFTQISELKCRLEYRTHWSALLCLIHWRTFSGLFNLLSNKM